MKIHKVLAQKISDKVMTVIPYNVNIMDEVGVIIGSGDKDRIGTFHQGAILAIEKRSIVSVFTIEYATKPGVNIPIRFKNRILGVIGISGDPDIVAPFAELVRITAELLISQEFLFQERRIQEQMKEEFLYQWVFRLEEYDEAFISNGETFHINLKLHRCAILIKGDGLKELYLSDQEYLFKYNQNMILYIVPDGSDFIKRLKSIHPSSKLLIGIGSNYTHLSQSIQEAKRAIDIVEKMELPLIFCYYKELRFIDYLINRDIQLPNISMVFKDLETNSKGKELIETLLCFIRYSGDINEIANELHIHRNSLAYRLQKIESLTNKSPKNYLELFELFTGYILYKMNNPANFPTER